jgi:hypothetical protein
VLFPAHYLFITKLIGEWCCHFPLPVHLLPTRGTTMPSPTSPAGSSNLSSPSCTATTASESPATTSSSPPAEAFLVHKETSLLCAHFVSQRACLISLFLLTNYLDLLTLEVPEQHYLSHNMVVGRGQHWLNSWRTPTIAPSCRQQSPWERCCCPGSTWFMWLSPVPFCLPTRIQDLLRRYVLDTVVVHCWTKHVPAGRDEPDGA